MDKIIIILNIIGSALIGTTIFFGYSAGYDVSYFVTHIYMALFASSMVILSQVAIFFYLIATGASIKESAREKDIDFGVDVFKVTGGFKKKAFPFAMLAILLAIATTAMGGAVHTGVLMPYIHGIVAWCTICASIYSAINAASCFKKNKVLILKVIDTEMQKVKT